MERVHKFNFPTFLESCFSCLPGLKYAECHESLWLKTHSELQSQSRNKPKGDQTDVQNVSDGEEDGCYGFDCPLL